MGYRFQTLDHPSYLTLILETVDFGLSITSDIAKSSMSFALIYLDSLIGLVFNGSDYPSNFTSILGIVDSSLSTTFDIAISSMYFALIFLDYLIGRIFDGLYGFSFVSFNGSGTLIILYIFFKVFFCL